MTNITTPAAAREAMERELEIGKLAARLRVDAPWRTGVDRYDEVAYERGARAGLTHLWPLLEAAQGVLDSLNCTCAIAYSKRGLDDPTCAYHEIDYALGPLRAAIEAAS